MIDGSHPTAGARADEPTSPRLEVGLAAKSGDPLGTIHSMMPGQWRPSRAFLARWLVFVTVLVGLTGAVLSDRTGGQDRAISDAWRRAVDADTSIIQVFDRGSAGQVALHPASTAEVVKPLVVGERITVVTPDGLIHNLRVCDPASPSANLATDCINSFVAKAVVPAVRPHAQRSL